MARWTDEQLSAIEARGENLLLAAAAGSGKTTVMVERVLQLIREGASIDDMLIVTFTRASAADMRAKLTEKLSALADMGDAHGRDQISRLESASISTIHAFCTSLLRTYFESAGVDPAFRILDDAENAACEDAAVDEAMEEAYARMDDGLKALSFGRGTQKVRELAVELYHQWQDGKYTSCHIDPVDGRSKSALNDLIGYAKDTQCSEILLKMYPLYVTGAPDMEALQSLSGVSTVYCEDQVIHTNNAAAEITQLYKKDGMEYTWQKAK